MLLDLTTGGSFPFGIFCFEVDFLVCFTSWEKLIEKTHIFSVSKSPSKFVFRK